MSRKRCKDTVSSASEEVFLVKWDVLSKRLTETTTGTQSHSLETLPHHALCASVLYRSWLNFIVCRMPNISLGYF